jgi:hypothetical protein
MSYFPWPEGYIPKREGYIPPFLSGTIVLGTVVPRIVHTPAQSVGLGGARLVALVAGGAGRACVPDLDFMSIGPTVALLVPGGFD